MAWNLTVAVTIPQSQSISLMSVFGWLTILSRVDLSFPTGLTLSSYTSGFGDILTNFWLGFERTYLLTNSVVNGGKTYRLRFELLASENNRLFVENIFPHDKFRIGLKKTDRNK